jgi:hypothetical protein
MQVRGFCVLLFALALAAGPSVATAMPLPQRTQRTMTAPSQQPVRIGTAGGETQAAVARDYERREQSAKHLEEFAGSGTVVYISTGAAILIGVIVLLLVL